MEYLYKKMQKQDIINRMQDRKMSAVPEFSVPMKYG